MCPLENEKSIEVAEKLTIVHIMNDCRNNGNGIINATVDLACEQAKLGYNVYVVSAGGSFCALLEQNSVRHIVINQDRTPLTILKALYQFHKILKKLNPEIVHAQMVTGLVLANLLKPLHNYKLVATMHNEWQKASKLMSQADIIVSVSYKIQNLLIQKGVPKRKIRVVQNGTVGSIRNTLDKNDITLKRPSVSIIAGLFHRKGVDVLMKAFELLRDQLPSVQLYIVGNGDQYENLLNLKKQSVYSDSIHFLGFKSNIPNILEQTDVFVLPSRNEPFGLVLSEARERGCAVVGSNVGGIPEVLEHGEKGMLFEPEDHDELAKILTTLFSDDSHLKYWKEQSQIGLEWLSVVRVCDETIEVYRAILSDMKPINCTDHKEI